MPVLSPATKNTSTARKQRRRLESLQTRVLEDKMSSEIPPLPPINRFSSSIRYAPTADSGSANVTYASLMTLFGVTVSTTSIASLVKAIKLRRVHVWLPPIVQTAATGIAPSEAVFRVRDVLVPGFGPEKVYRLTASGKGAHVCHKFRGMVSSWLNNDGVATLPAEIFLFFRWGTVRPIIQLDFSVQLPCNDTATSGDILTTHTVDATNASRFYFCYLDSAATVSTEGTQLLEPMLVPTVTINEPAAMVSGLTPTAVSSSSSTSSGSCCATGCCATRG
jgi:hypothetical protein